MTAVANRLTITLSAQRYLALKQAAAQRNKTIGQLIDESLEFYGIKTREEALDILQRAAKGSGLTATQISDLAVAEVRAYREERTARHR